MKNNLKLILLFALTLILIIIGVNMYKQIRDNQINYNTDIYSHLPLQTKEVIYVSRNYNLETIFWYDSTFTFLDQLGQQFTYPVLISKSNSQSLLLTRTTANQYQQIKNILEHNISTLPPKIRKHKDYNIFFYAMPQQTFLACTLCDGIFVASTDYKSVETYIDSQKNYNIIIKQHNPDQLKQITSITPINLLLKHNDDLLVLNYNLKNDSLLLDGYILGNDVNLEDYSKDSLSIFSPRFLSSTHVQQQEGNIIINAVLNKK